jgi:hypothetical protein
MLVLKKKSYHALNSKTEIVGMFLMHELQSKPASAI